MNFAEYSKIDAMNFSTLKVLHDSPKHFRHAASHPRADKPAWIWGRAGHCVILEPEAFPGRYIRAPETFQDTKGKEKPASWALKSAKEWRDALAAADQTGMMPKDFDAMAPLATAVLGHAVAGPLLTGGQAEVLVDWVDEATGLKCKARVDYLSSTVVDLKTAADIRQREFGATAARMLYHGQLMFYFDGAIAAGLLPADAPAPWLVAIEKEAPYDVAAYYLTEADMEAGRVLKRGLLRLFTQCVSANMWPGRVPDATGLSLAPWAPGMGGSVRGDEVDEF